LYNIINHNTFSVVPPIINGRAYKKSAVPLKQFSGATTLSITTLSLTTLSIMTLSITFK
jgi:hypothetical protein